jgi:hypothetical protein
MHVRLQQQLGGDMALLFLLRLLEALVAVREIGAGILAIRVEEEIEQLGREIVMMGDIRARAAERIVLLQITQGSAKPLAQPLNRMAIGGMPTTLRKPPGQQTGLWALRTVTTPISLNSLCWRRQLQQRGAIGHFRSAISCLSPCREALSRGGG